MKHSTTMEAELASAAPQSGRRILQASADPRGSVLQHLGITPARCVGLWSVATERNRSLPTGCPKTAAGLRRRGTVLSEIENVIVALVRDAESEPDDASDEWVIVSVDGEAECIGTMSNGRFFDAADMLGNEWATGNMLMPADGAAGRVPCRCGDGSCMLCDDNGQVASGARQ